MTPDDPRPVAAARDARAALAVLRAARARAAATLARLAPDDLLTRAAFETRLVALDAALAALGEPAS